MRVATRLLLSIGPVVRTMFGFQTPNDLHDDSYVATYYEREVRIGQRFLQTTAVRGRTLDVGCGFGGLLKALEDEGVEAVGVDNDADRVAYAVGRGHHAHVGDAERLPFVDGEFETVVSWAVLEHIPDIYAAMREIQRVLRPGGRFVTNWGPSWLNYNGAHLIKALGVPWVHLLFSRRTVVEALEEQKLRGTWPVSYLDYKLADYAAMGRNTRGKVHDAARLAGLEVVESSSTSPSRVLSLLARSPMLGELFTGSLRLELRKP